MKKQPETWSRLVNCGSLLFTLPLLSGCGRREFDTAFGPDDTWAAEKHLIGLLRAEGFQTVAEGPNNGFARTNRRNGDGAVITFITRTASRELSHYTLSTPLNSPGAEGLLSIAKQIGPDRISLINEAIQEFNRTKLPCLKQTGTFTQRGEFSVRVDESSIELDNLWRSKRGI